MRELARQKAKEVLTESKSTKKQEYKQEKSMKSSMLLFGSEARKSASRNTERQQDGRFAAGGVSIGEGVFVKKDLMKGKQRWECRTCKKRTTNPEEHAC